MFRSTRGEAAALLSLEGRAAHLLVLLALREGVGTSSSSQLNSEVSSDLFSGIGLSALAPRGRCLCRTVAGSATYGDAKFAATLLASFGVAIGAGPG